jgi:hypothetical protein
VRLGHAEQGEDGPPEGFPALGVNFAKRFARARLTSELRLGDDSGSRRKS